MTATATPVNSTDQVNQLLNEGNRARGMMNQHPKRYKRETVIVLRFGTKPTIFNLLFRKKVKALHLGKKGMILLGCAETRFYQRCWQGKSPYCFELKLNELRQPRLNKLLRRVRVLIHECI